MICVDQFVLFLRKTRPLFIIYLWFSSDPGCKLLLLQLQASTNQELSQQIPQFNLPSKILCRVMNIQLMVTSAMNFEFVFRKLSLPSLM